jgi:ERF superfamily
MEKSPLIYAKISAVMKDIGPIAKDNTNKEQHYQFRGIDALMNAISPILAKHGVVPTTYSITDVVDAEIVARSGSKGYREVRRFTFRFFAEDGSYVDTMADGEAIDYGDKGSNKANSVAYREAMFKMFVIPFEEEDIEATNHDIEANTGPIVQSSRTATTPKPPVPAKDPEIVLKAAKSRVMFLLNELGKPPKTKKQCEDAVFDLTGLVLEDANLDEIADALAVKLEALR